LNEDLFNHYECILTNINILKREKITQELATAIKLMSTDIVKRKKEELQQIENNAKKDVTVMAVDALISFIGEFIDKLRDRYKNLIDNSLYSEAEACAFIHRQLTSHLNDLNVNSKSKPPATPPDAGEVG